MATTMTLMLILGMIVSVGPMIFGPIGMDALQYLGQWYSGYWSNMGYTQIPDPDTGATEEILIDHCHYRMNTSYEGGTSNYLVGPGMEIVSDITYSYDFDDYFVGYSWSTAKSELISDYPFVLNIEGYPFYYQNHAVCVFGYVEEGSEKSIRVFNTWDTDVNYYITDGAWISASMSELHP